MSWIRKLSTFNQKQQLHFAGEKEVIKEREGRIYLRIWYIKRIRGVLDLDMGETLEEASIRKSRIESLCRLFWKRMEK